MGYVYILVCSDSTYYTGSTKDLDRRLWQHKYGFVDYTKRRLPVKLVYFEYCDRIDAAFMREKQIQGWSRQKKEALIKESPVNIKDVYDPSTTLRVRN